MQTDLMEENRKQIFKTHVFATKMFKGTVVVIEWSDSRRVDCVLYRCIHNMITIAGSHSKLQWMILNGKTVGGLTVYCVDIFTTQF